MFILACPVESWAADIPVPRSKPAGVSQSVVTDQIVVPRPNPHRGGDNDAVPLLATDIRITKDAKNTRFVLELTHKIDFRIFTLADPYRVVIDFPEIGFKLPQGFGSKRTGAVLAFRYGLFQPGNSRAVLDLSNPVQVLNAEIVKPLGGFNYQLVLDLVPVTKEQFAKTAGWPDPQTTPTSIPAPSIEQMPQTKPGKLVVIDPGHGGIDPGASSSAIGLEKALVLIFAKKLALELEKEHGIQVALTRERDIFLSLRDRVQIARSQGADLFISIHADTLPSPLISGASVYTLDETATDEEAAELAAGENQADVIAGVDLQGEEEEVASILITLVQRETNNNSVEFARALVDDLRKITPVLPTGHRQAGFRVLKAPDIPSVLLELGFISNKKDSIRLTSPEWQEKVAQGVSKSVADWLAQKP